MTITVSALSIDDVVEAMALAHDAHATSNYSDLPFCGEHVARVFARHMTSPAAVALGAWRDGVFCGFLLASVEHSFCAPVPVASDTVFIVRPGSGFAAIRMIQAYVRWALDAGAVRISLGCSSGIDAGRFGRLLERSGFVSAGGLFVLEAHI